jgi:hypothetical protein
VRTTRRRVAAIATAVVLGMGAVGCADAGDKGATRGDKGQGPSTAAPTRSGNLDTTAYRGQLLAHLKGTPQGAHVTKVEATKDKIAWGLVIDTDLPAYAETDYRAPARASLDKIGYEAVIWLVDNPHPDIAFTVLHIATADRANISAAGPPGPAEEQRPLNALAADLTTALRTRPEGAHVTRVWITQFAGEASIQVVSDLEPYDRYSIDAYSPANKPRVETGKAIIAACVEWARKQTGTKITGVVLLDREKGHADTDLGELDRP